MDDLNLNKYIIIIMECFSDEDDSNSLPTDDQTPASMNSSLSESSYNKSYNNAPINNIIMPHYPLYGHRWGKTGDCWGNSLIDLALGVGLLIFINL